MSATEINLGEDRRRSSNVETTSTSQTSSERKSPDLTMVISNTSTPHPHIPRSPSQPQNSKSSCSCATAVPDSASTRGRRPQLGQSLSVDHELPASPTLPEIVISGRDEHLAVDDDPLYQQRKGSASSEGSCGGRKSPRERLVLKMSRVFK